MSNPTAKSLYNALINKGYTSANIGDEETFISAMTDKANRKDLFDMVVNDGYDLGDYDAFEGRFTSQPTNVEQPAVEQPMAQVPEPMKSDTIQPVQPIAQPTIVAQNESQTNGDYAIGFKQGLEQGWKGLKEGARYFAGETANVFTGSSEDEQRAIEAISRLEEEGVNIADYAQPLSKSLERVYKRGIASSGDNISTLTETEQEQVRAILEENEIKKTIADAIKEAGGDLDKAKQLLSRAATPTWGDRTKADAADEMSKMKPTKGFGAWVGNLIPQMIPSAAAIALSAVTKNPKYAKLIGHLGMGTMTASTAGQSMKEARDAGASGSEVWAVGIADGIIEYATEKIPFDRYTTRLFNGTKRKVGQELTNAVVDNNSPARNELEKLLTEANKKLGGKLLNGKTVKDYATDVLAEGASEFTAEALQTITPMIYENPDDYPTITEILQNGWEGAKAGLFMGSVLGGASKIAEHQQQRSRRQQQGFVDVAQVQVKDDGTAEVGEVIGVNNENGNLSMLIDGEVKEFAPESVIERHRFSFEEFDTGVMQMEENEAYDNGYSLETPQEKNDAQNMFEYQQQQMRQYFGLGEDGDVDAFLGDDPIAGLQRVAANDREAGQVVLDYLNAKATVDGVFQRMSDDAEAKIAEADAIIASRTNRNNGLIQRVRLKNDKQAYVLSGDIVMTDDGDMVNVSKSSESLVVIDAITGKKEYTYPSNIAEVYQSVDAEAERQTLREQVIDEYSQKLADDMNGTLAFAPGDNYTLVDDQGAQHNVQIVADNGDGTVAVVEVMPDGVQQEAVMAKSTIQEMSDTHNQLRLGQYLQDKKAQEIAFAEQEAQAEQPEVVAEEQQQQPVSALSQVPKDKKGKHDFNQVSPDIAWNAIVEMTGGAVDDALDTAKQMQKQSNDALKAAQKEKPKVGTDVESIIANKNAHKEKVNGLQAIADHWANIVALGEQSAQQNELTEETAPIAEQIEVTPEVAPVAEEVVEPTTEEQAVEQVLATQTIPEISLDERIEMQKRIIDWLSEDNLKKAEGKTRAEILEMFGNTPMPIAYITSDNLSYVSKDAKDPRIYCGKGYFIDHALRNHSNQDTHISAEDVDVSKYLNMQSVLNDPDSLKETFVDGKRTVVFVKKIGRYFAELTQFEENGKIVLHKSLFSQKKEPYAKLKDIRQKETSSEGGVSSISRTEESSAPAISLESRGDVISESKDTTTEPITQEVEQENLQEEQNEQQVDVENVEQTDVVAEQTIEETPAEEKTPAPLQLAMSNEEFDNLLASDNREQIEAYLKELDQMLVIDEDSPFVGEKALREEFKQVVEQYGGKDKVPAEVMDSFNARYQPYADLQRAIYDRKYALGEKLAQLNEQQTTNDKQKESEAKTAHKQTAFNGFLANKTDLAAATAEKALQKKYKFEDKNYTVAEYVEQAVASGNVELKTKEVPKYAGASRRAWNKMDAREQAADAERVKNSGTKTEYYVNGYDLGKTGYDYAQYLQAKAKDQTPETASESQPQSAVEPEWLQKVPTDGRNFMVYTKVAGENNYSATDLKTGQAVGLVYASLVKRDRLQSLVEELPKVLLEGAHFQIRDTNGKIYYSSEPIETTKGKKKAAAKLTTLKTVSGAEVKVPINLYKYVSTDKTRAYTGVYFDPEGFVVATDGHNMIAVKHDVAEADAEKFISKAGDVASTIFNWRIASPKPNTEKAINVDFEDVEKQIGGKAGDKFVVFEIDGQEVGFPPKAIHVLADFQRAFGGQAFVGDMTAGKAIVIRSGDNYAIALQTTKYADLSQAIHIPSGIEQTTEQVEQPTAVSEQAQQPTEPTKQEPKPKRTADRKIEDYGEKIAGARKDILRNMSKNFDNATIESLIALPFAKAFVKPDLKKLVEAGVLRPDDAKYAEAIMWVYINKNKPKARKTDVWAAKRGRETRITSWAKKTFDGITRLRDFIEADEATRDELIAQYGQLGEQIKANEDIDRVRLNRLNGGALVFGDLYSPNPIEVVVAALDKLNYQAGDKITFDAPIVKAEYLGRYFNFENQDGEKVYAFSRANSIEEAIDTLVLQAKIRRGDTDIQYPTDMFSITREDPIREPSGMFTVFHINKRGSLIPETVEGREAAEKKVADYQSQGLSADLREEKKIVGYATHRIRFKNRLTDVETIFDEKFGSEGEARQALEERYDEFNDLANDYVASLSKQKREQPVPFEVTTSWNSETKVVKYVVKNTETGDVMSPQLDTRKEAEEYYKNHIEEWKAKWQEMKDARKKFVFFDDNVKPREGKDYRNGRDVTAEDLATTFGFRGIQFGNWTNDADRQAALNQAYDAFMDLADILGVSPKALSLAGELGIAFGARGGGSALAHYEPDEIVINLTKTKGAGSLAHEWWHALDNYFSRQGNIPMGFVTSNPAEAKMREEMRAAWQGVVKAVKGTEYAKRSMAQGDYWGRMLEMTARLFGEWTVYELAKTGRTNHFLSRGITPGRFDMWRRMNYAAYKWSLPEDQTPMSFEEFALLPRSLKGMPFPTKEETEQMGEAVRNLFDVVQEKVDEQGNVVLFQRGDFPEMPNTEANRRAYNLVREKLQNAGIKVHEVSEEMANAMASLIGVEFATKRKSAPETASVQQEHQPTVVSSADGAKVLKDLDSAITEYENKSSHPKTLLGDIAKVLNAKKRGSNSQYATFEAVNGKVFTIRLANHNAKTSTFDNHNEDEGISIVVTAQDNTGITNNGNAHLVEFFYDAIKLRKADGKPLVEILKSIKQALYSGEYVDTTGLAEREEVNLSDAEYQIVYHGSGAKFDRFDHSFMGTGEGAQAYGWGTYVTQVEGIGKTYAEQISYNNNEPLQTLQYQLDILDGNIAREKEDLEWHIKLTTAIDKWLSEAQEEYDNFVKEAERLKAEFGEESPEYRNYIFYDYQADELAKAKRSKADNTKTIAFKRDRIATLEYDRNKLAQDIANWTPPTAYLYSVDIIDNLTPDTYISWVGVVDDEVIDRMQEKLTEEYGEDVALTANLKYGQSGQHFYQKLERALDSDRAASEFLHRNGFVGIEYPAQYQSGGRADNAKNYVIFNEDDLKIIDRVELFQDSQGKIYGWAVGGEIYLTPDGLNANTAIHEYSHLWVEALRKKDSKKWAEIKSQLQATPFWQQVIDDPNYERIRENEDAVASEVLARLSGNKGAERLANEAQRIIDAGNGNLMARVESSALVQHVKRLLRDFYAWVARNVFGVTNEATISQLSDMVVDDLLDEVALDNIEGSPYEAMVGVSEDTRFRITPAMDKAYMDAVERGNMETAQRMVDEAAKAAGYNEKVYHGTQFFGFTKFGSQRPSGAIFTSDKRNVAANYGGGNRYASVRRINQGYKGGRASEEVISDARSVFDQEWRMVNDEERSVVIDKIEADAKRVMQKMNSLQIDVPTEIQENVAWVENIIYTTAEGRENGNNGDEMQRMLLDDYEQFVENRSALREWLGDHRSELTMQQQQYLDYLIGYEVFDVAVDAGHSFANAFSSDEIATVDGLHFVPISKLWEETRKAANVGSYELYGNLGDRPLIINGEGKAWYGLDFNGMRSTDDIVEWAKQEGYTSVVFNNISDNGDPSDVKVFFNPEQVKSADPVTYDDNGNVIPLSERFNSRESDIRFRSDVDEVFDADFANLESEYQQLDKNDEQAMAEWRAKKKQVVEDYLGYMTEQYDLPCSVFVFDHNNEQSLQQAFETYINTLASKSLLWKTLRKFARQWAYDNFKSNFVGTSTRGVRIKGHKASIYDIGNGVDLNKKEDWLNALLHENTHYVVEMLGISDVDNSKLWEEFAHNGKPVTVARYVRDYNTTERRVSELLAYSVGDFIKPERVELFDSFMNGNATVEDILKFYNESLPLRNDYVRTILNELKNGRKVREEIDRTSRQRRNQSGREIVADRISQERDSQKSRFGRTSNERDGQPRRDLTTISEAAEELAEQLHTPIRIIGDVSEINDDDLNTRRRKRSYKGWYDVSTGEVVVVAPNATSVADVQRTVIHEVVAHNGLRELFGADFDTFLDNVYRNVDEPIRRAIANLAARKGWDFRVATEEYLASLAETTNFEEIEKQSWWQKIKDYFMDLLRKVGIKLAKPLTNDELRYILWRSYQMQKSKGAMAVAEDVDMQRKLGVGNFRTRQANVEQINAEFNKQLDSLTEENAREVILNVGMPSSLLRDYGVEDKPIRLYGAKLLSKIRKHGYQINDVKNLPLALRSPIAIFKGSEAGSFAILTELRIGDNNVLVTLSVGKGGHDVDFNIISSVYGKRGDSVARWINNEKLLYVNKEKALDYLSVSAPIAEAQNNQELDSATKIVEEFDNSKYKASKNMPDNIRAREGSPTTLSEYEGEDIEADFADYDAGAMTFEESITNGLVKLSQANQESAELRMNAIRAIGGNLAKLRRAMNVQRKYDKAAIDSVIRIAKMAMNSGFFNGLSHTEVNRLLTLINKAASSRDITKQARAVVDMLLQHQVREAKRVFEKMLKVRGSKVDNRGIIVQGKLDSDGQRMVAAFKEGIKLDPDTLQERIDQVLDEMGSDDSTIAANASVKYQGLMLAQQYVNEIRQSEIEEAEIKRELQEVTEAKILERDDYAEFVESVEDAIRENRLERIEAYNRMIIAMGEGMNYSIARAKKWREEQKERVQQIHHDANSDLQGVPTDEHSQLTWKQKIANNGLLRFAMQPLATFDQMLRFFGSKDVDGRGYLWNRFMSGFTAATDKEWKNKQAAQNELSEKLSKIMGKQMRITDVFSMMRKMPTVSVQFWDSDARDNSKREDKDKKTYELTQGNLLYIYMVNKMSDGRMKLRKMGISEQDVANITKLIDPRFIEFADWLQEDFLVRKRNEYNEVHQRMFGASMAAIENYFPLVINSRSRNVAEKIEEQKDDNARPSTITGSIIKRVRNSVALDLTNADAFAVILDHVDQMERWAAFAEFNRDLNALLSYKRFRNRVLNMSSARFGAGTTLWKNFKDTCAIAAGVYRPKGGSAIDATVLNLAKGVTASKISLRLWTAVKQVLSVPAFATEANTWEFIKAFNPTNMADSWNWAIEELPTFAKRWQSRQAGDSRLRKTDLDWGFTHTKILETTTRIGMSPNAFIDALACVVGAKAIYETKYKRYLKQGYNEAQAKQKALDNASVAFNETQQSSEDAYLSAMQVDRTVASVALSVFRNSNMAYTRRLMHALSNLKRRLKEGYNEESIAFMAKQMMREGGLTETQANANATKAYNQQGYKDIADVVLFGIGLKLMWELGSNLHYLIMGDDDEEKKQIIEDALVRSIAGPIEGLAGGDIVADAIGWKLSGKGFYGYSFGSLPLMDDIQNTLSKFDSDKVAAINDVLNILVASTTGVNLQTLTDTAVAIIDAVDADPATSKEVVMLIMRIMQVPQSQIDEIYIDELGINAREARDLNPDALAHRYAEYKRKKAAPITGIFYDKEGKEKADEKYVKRFNKMRKERIENAGDPLARKIIEEYENDELLDTEALSKEINAQRKESESEYFNRYNRFRVTPEYNRYQTYKQKQKEIDKAIKEFDWHRVDQLRTALADELSKSYALQTNEDASK